MPLTGTITEARTGRSLEYTNSSGNTVIRRRIFYDVLLSGLGDDPASYAVVGDDEILALAALPRVNFSVHTFNNKLIPYLLCRKKRLIPNPNMLRRPKVECAFDYEQKGKEGEQPPVDPPDDPEDLDPRLDFSSRIEDKVVYKDRNGKLSLTPTGNRYAEPMLAPLTIPIITATQYENNFDEDKIAERTNVANEADWRNKPIYSWKIADVRADETAVPISGGSTVECHQVVYTLEHNPLSDGWKETRALIDTHYLKDVDGTMKKFPFMDGGQRTTGWIKEDGTIQPRADGLLFDTFELLEKVNFNDFLARVEPL